MELKDLKKVIPHKWRVQSTNQYGSQCVAYVDARDVQDLLDDVCGAENWQVVYEEHKGNLFAKIGIKLEDSKVSGLYEWVWKSDCGTESNIEKQKGESSDAFKRAAVMWGVGRFLYSKPIIKIKEVIEKNGKYFPAQNGQRIWDVNKYCNNLNNVTIPVQEDKDRKPALTLDQFEKTKKGTKEQMQTVLNKCRMTPTQRENLTLLIKKFDLK